MGGIGGQRGGGSFRIPGKQSTLGKCFKALTKKKHVLVRSAATERLFKRRRLLLGKDSVMMFEKSNIPSEGIELCRVILAVVSTQSGSLRFVTSTVSSAS